MCAPKETDGGNFGYYRGEELRDLDKSPSIVGLEFGREILLENI
jgi:hypothetical protein